MFTNIFRGRQQLIVNATVDELDLAEYVKNGLIDLYIRVNSGVRVGKIHSSATINSSGSRVSIINNGDIWGYNGSGCNYVSYKWPSIRVDQASRGGSAIALSCPIIIDNTNGNIFGGGGGGGGTHNVSGVTGVLLLGGGGRPPGDSAVFIFGQTIVDAKDAGLFGSGDGAYLQAYPTSPAGSCNGPGLAGQTVSGTYPGGSVGYSVNANGNPVTWLGGFNSTQVKGSVV
jgi:hypothetical protein